MLNREQINEMREWGFNICVEREWQQLLAQAEAAIEFREACKLAEDRLSRSGTTKDWIALQACRDALAKPEATPSAAADTRCKASESQGQSSNSTHTPP